MKLLGYVDVLQLDLSLPPWERGLKRVQRGLHPFHVVVDPPVGAWIETAALPGYVIRMSVAPPRGSVD